jgi:hypothetical protein
VKSIYAGGAEARDLIDYYSIDYIYFGARERETGANQKFFDDQYSVIYRSPNIIIYDAHHGIREDAISERAPAPAPREFASRVGKDPYQLLVEFPRTSFAACRLYEVAFGRMPRYEEFMSDMTVIGRGLFIGAPGWQQVLDRNQSALVEQWLGRSDFKSAYDNKTNEQYVETLNSNADHSLSRAERDALVSALNNQSQSRGTVLRRITERSSLGDKDYNSAYVLIHYFGYFHRNPDDPPDNDMRGFNFWLDDLERSGDYRSLTRAFIESGEYLNKSRKH